MNFSAKMSFSFEVPFCSLMSLYFSSPELLTGFHFDIFSVIHSFLFFILYQYNTGNIGVVMRYTYCMCLAFQKDTIQFTGKYKTVPKVSSSYWLIDWFWSQEQILLFLLTYTGRYIRGLPSQHAPTQINIWLSSTLWILLLGTLQSQVATNANFIFNIK